MDDEIHILLVEDNPGDVRLTREALRGAKVANDLHVVGDGEAAIDYLRRRGRYTDAPRPDIVLLDLNLPRLDGREVLSDIKSDPELAKIPIIILTSSSAERDINSAYELHANCYISKPVDFTEFIEAVRSLEGFWLRIVRLPK
ncbi:response regulator [Mycobacterium sp. SA01]|uniref:response regulator n=1 Tax=Mycobacterium sp. SA01 TaxID=3238820 RepID=UPI00351AEF71